MLAAWPSPAKDRPTEVLEHLGMSDASAAVAAGPDMFVVADDETNALRVYARDRGGPPLAICELNGFLQPDPRSPEVDLEAATSVGQRAYWLSSHGRNRDGKYRPSRQRLFATDIEVREGRVSVRPVGKPYTRLLRDIVADPQVAKYGLAAAALRPPKAPGGFNIEGLAATPDGRMLIGLRNPLFERRAILLVLLNAPELIEGAHTARWGPPVELDLGGLGVRSIEYWPDAQRYVIAAGPTAGGACELYFWSGTPADRPEHIAGLNLKGWRPEGLVIYPGQPLDRLQLISDDGRRQRDTRQRVGGKSFRTGWVPLP